LTNILFLLESIGVLSKVCLPWIMEVLCMYVY
jgi:hypothetical protein